MERHYWGIATDKLNVKTQWVLDNVIPIMGDYEACTDERELLSKTWEVWEKFHKSSYVIADVCYPVEVRLFEKCVYMDLQNRIEVGPFPLIDLSSILLAKGIDPLIERTELLHHNLGRRHNALHDVEISIEIWKMVMSR